MVSRRQLLIILLDLVLLSLLFAPNPSIPIFKSLVFSQIDWIGFIQQQHQLILSSIPTGIHQFTPLDPSSHPTLLYSTSIQFHPSTTIQSKSDSSNGASIVVCRNQSTHLPLPLRFWFQSLCLFSQAWSKPRRQSNHQIRSSPSRSASRLSHKGSTL